MLSGYTGEGRKKMPRTLGRGYALAFHEDADTRRGHKDRFLTLKWIQNDKVDREWCYAGDPLRLRSGQALARDEKRGYSG